MSVQNDLFSGTQVVERHLAASGTTVRLRLEPLPDGRVRIVEYLRRRATEQRFRRERSEEDRVLPYERLGLAQPFHEVFGRSP